MEATLTFPKLDQAKQFAKMWSRYSHKGHTISAGTVDVTVSIYGITEDGKVWIDNYVEQINKELV